MLRWYQENSVAFPSICSSAEVQIECPVACGTYPPCFGSGEPIYVLYISLMCPFLEGVPGAQRVHACLCR